MRFGARGYAAEFLELLDRLAVEKQFGRLLMAVSGPLFWKRSDRMRQEIDL